MFGTFSGENIFMLIALNRLKKCMTKGLNSEFHCDAAEGCNSTSNQGINEMGFVSLFARKKQRGWNLCPSSPRIASDQIELGVDTDRRAKNFAKPLLQSFSNIFFRGSVVECTVCSATSGT